MNNNQIIKSLCEYYDRAVQHDHTIPVYGFSLSPIRYSVVIDMSGNFVEMKSYAKGFQDMVPAKTGNQKSATFLWGKPKFVLGWGISDETNICDACSEFVEKIQNFPYKNKYLNAVLNFYAKFDANEFGYEEFEASIGIKEWEFICENNNTTNCNIIFEVVEKKVHVKPHNTKEVLDNIDFNILGGNPVQSYCQVTDSVSMIAGLHQKSGTLGTFVSYDKDAFKSYGFDKGDHCAISSLAAHKYFQAMELMSNKNTFYIGGLDGIRLYVWTDSENPNDYVKDIIDIFKSDGKVRPNTKFDPDDGDVNCYILGVKKNMGRCSYEFFDVVPLSVLYNNVGKFLAPTRYTEYYSDDYLNVPIWYMVDHYIKTSMSKNPQEKVMITLMFIKNVLCGKDDGKLPIQFIRNFSIRLEEKVRSGATISRRSAVVAKFLLDKCHYQKDNTTMEQEMNVGESCGRIYAIYEKMYKRYLRETGEGKNSIDYKLRMFRMKYFPRALNNPQVLFRELPTYFCRILPKVSRNGSSTYNFYEGVIRKMIVGIDTTKKSYTPVEKASFAYGYNDELQFKKVVDSTN